LRISKRFVLKSTFKFRLTSTIAIFVSIVKFEKEVSPEFTIAVLKKVRYALCPMPYALCPMPYAHEYLIFLRKAIHQIQKKQKVKILRFSTFVSSPPSMRPTLLN